MKHLTKMMSIIGLVMVSQLVIAGEITDSFADGDTLTAESLNNAKDAINDNDARITALEATYEIGDTGPAGGWVFYVDADGRHGLEAAPTLTDQSTGILWGASTATGATGDGLGAGKMNTMLIIAQNVNDTLTYAAGNAANLMIASAGVMYGDWYLPSNYELELMYLNIGQGSTTLGNVGGFAQGAYWSSTELGVTNNAIFFDFSAGNNNENNKNSLHRVRAVRAF